MLNKTEQPTITSTCNVDVLIFVIFFFKELVFAEGREAAMPIDKVQSVTYD